MGNCFVTKGESAKPHTAAELKNKFIALGDPLWGQDQTLELFAALSNLESLQNVSDLSTRFAL
jgi:hypothetical protein